VARFSKRSLEGEILIDHRASPGLDPEVAAWMGVPLSACAGGTVYEGAFYVCAHCQCEIVKNPERTRARGYCAKCDKYICDECEFVQGKTLACRSAQRQMDELLEVIEQHGSVSPLLLRQGD
jgi:hypothetical protein